MMKALKELGVRGGRERETGRQGSGTDAAGVPHTRSETTAGS